ncbi:MAG: DUF4142 domain-containing protein [Saprospirales bacterium]|nr:MAG: DUF4142 domain-containing protein [Saprospirales bacterium]
MKMKKIITINETMLLIIMATGIFLFTSCSENQNSPDVKEVAEERNEAKFNESSQQNDAQFLVNASEINLMQIQLGQLAQEKGKTSEVRDLGKMMKLAHTKSQKDLTALAQRKGISILSSPSNNTMDAYKKLNEKSRDDFDKAYTDMMVKDHKDAIRTFEKASKNSRDGDIKNWATASLRQMRDHLDHSIDSQKKLLI